MADTINDIWVYLAASPLLSLTLTLAVFQVASLVYERSGRVSVLNPVLVSVLVLSVVLLATGTPYDVYFEGAQFIHFLLGPATVALAIPLYRQLERVKRSAVALTASLLCGTITASGTALGLGYLFGLDRTTLYSVIPKSVTAPVAMGIADEIGGLPSLTAVLVILTGIIGAAFGPALLDRLKITNDAARGMGLGTASHGIGTARAFQESEVGGAFSGLAMGLNALATAVLLSIVFAVFG